jgi:uncharacterized protein (DUF736 family)
MNDASHRICEGRAEVGVTWSKCSEEGRDYSLLEFDDS